METNWKITKIRIGHFMGVTSFQMDKVGRYNKITGHNGSGKSSILEAIRATLVSTGNDTDVIQLGADKAETAIVLNDRMFINRDIFATNNKLKVVLDENTILQPQTVLKKMLGAYNFNPVEFFLASPKDRRKILLSAMPITVSRETLADALDGFSDLVNLSEYDFSEHALSLIEKVQAKAYDARHQIGQEVVRLEKSIEQDKQELPAHTEEPVETNLAELTNAHSEASKLIRQHEQDIKDLNVLSGNVNTITERIARLKQELELSEVSLKNAKADYDTKQFVIDCYAAPDIDAIQGKIDAYETTQKLRMRLQDIERREVVLKETDARHKKLDALNKFLVGELPRKLLAQAKLPIEGLSIVGDSITLNGVALDKLSHSEQIRFGLEIARALSGSVKFICVDNMEALSPNNQQEFAESTKGDGFQYFVTVVTDEPLNSEVIE